MRFTFLTSFLVLLLVFARSGAFSWLKAVFLRLAKRYKYARPPREEKGQLKNDLRPEALHLCRAAGQGDLATVQELMDGYGQDVNATDHYGCTPLHRAARSGQLNVVIFLLEKGAKVDAQDDEGRTPWYEAAVNRRQEIAMMLLEKGADTLLKGPDGVTMKDAAFRDGYRASPLDV